MICHVFPSPGDMEAEKTSSETENDIMMLTVPLFEEVKPMWIIL